MLVGSYLKAELLNIARAPVFLGIGMALPVMVFAFFGTANADSPAAANFIMGSFSVFAVLGITFNLFAIGVAEERTSPWEDFLRTLPVPVWQRFLAKVIAALAATLIGVAVLVLAAHLLTPIALSPARWVQFLVSIIVGGIPFALLALTLGYSLPGKSASAAATLTYLPLSFLGGIWLPPDQLPAALDPISRLLPSRHAGELVWAAVAGQGWPGWAVLGVAAWTAIGAAGALWAYRRYARSTYR